MLKAKSAECRQQTPLNDGEIFRKKQRGWIDEKTLVVTKEQQAALSNEHFKAVQEIGKKLYEGK
jgi:sulfur relay (sulfurtransferase) DsrC/TusE family protein